ncbi:MAG TPA: glycosyltransferase family 4 protein [Chloroflexota bacterium]|nr:glycosyltransferase family 4 protein [Chloroflexota bacterium]
MRVLHVLEATIGGTKRHLLDLAPGLRSRGIDVEVACPRVRDQHHGDTSFWDDLALAGIPTHEVAMTRRPLTAANAAALGRLASLMRRGAYDVVHAQSSVAGALGRLAARLVHPRPRVVYSPHGFAFLGNEWGTGPRRAAFLGLERALAPLADRLICVSSAEADDAVRHGVAPRHKVSVIPNGVVSAGFAADRGSIADMVPDLAPWRGLPIVGTLARMTPQKDPLVWLEVASRLRAAAPNARFVWIWGGGALEPDVYETADRLGLRGVLRFLGYREDARAVLGGLDIFLLTSRFEGLPYAVIEALAAGTPVVATDVSGTRDVVRHERTGYLAPPGDAGALAAYVLRLLGDPDLRRRLGAAGRADVLERFSIERMVDQTAALYATLLGR